MPVKVDIVGHARDLFDHPVYLFDARHGMTVRDVFKELSKRSIPGHGDKLYDAATGRVNEHFAVFVNSREIRSLDGPETRLKEGDVITILPPMAGG